MSGVESLTAKDVELLKLGYGMLALNKTMSGYKFMMRMFQKHPELQDKFTKFRGIPLADLQYNGKLTSANKGLVVHGLMTIYRLESYIDSLDDIDMLDELVRTLGIEHIPRKVTMSEFMLVALILHDLMDDCCQGCPDYLPGIKFAWTKLMGAVVAIFAIAQARGR